MLRAICIVMFIQGLSFSFDLRNCFNDNENRDISQMQLNSFADLEFQFNLIRKFSIDFTYIDLDNLKSISKLRLERNYPEKIKIKNLTALSLKEEFINKSYNNDLLTSNNLVFTKFILSEETIPKDLIDEKSPPLNNTPFYNIITSLLRGYFAGYGEAHRIREQYTNDAAVRKHSGTIWHDYAIARDAATICVGVAIAEYSEFNFWKIIQGMFTAAAVNFFTFQMSYNLELGRLPFYQSKYTTSRVESLASFPLLSIFLITALTLEIII